MSNVLHFVGMKQVFVRHHGGNAKNIAKRMKIRIHVFYFVISICAVKFMVTFASTHELDYNNWIMTLLPTREGSLFVRGMRATEFNKLMQIYCNCLHIDFIGFRKHFLMYHSHRMMTNPISVDPFSRFLLFDLTVTANYNS